jgi:hypothetical protein
MSYQIYTISGIDSFGQDQFEHFLQVSIRQPQDVNHNDYYHLCLALHRDIKILLSEKYPACSLAAEPWDAAKIYLCALTDAEAISLGRFLEGFIEKRVQFYHGILTFIMQVDGKRRSGEALDEILAQAKEGGPLVPANSASGSVPGLSGSSVPGNGRKEKAHGG